MIAAQPPVHCRLDVVPHASQSHGTEVVCAVFIYLQLCNGCMCCVYEFTIVQWLYLQWLMVVHPVGHMVSCHKVALPIPIHNQPFLHSDSTKMHTEKVRPFSGVDYGEKYKNVQTQLFLGVSSSALYIVQCQDNFRLRLSGPQD